MTVSWPGGRPNLLISAKQYRRLMGIRTCPMTAWETARALDAPPPYPPQGDRRWRLGPLQGDRRGIPIVAHIEENR